MAKPNTQIWNMDPPANGWCERTYYVVEAQYSSNNIVHRAILYTGFLNGPNNTPGGYAKLFNGGYDNGTQDVAELWSVKYVAEITEMKQKD